MSDGFLASFFTASRGGAENGEDAENRNFNSKSRWGRGWLGQMRKLYAARSTEEHLRDLRDSA
jgi:hypothetical protein